MGIKSIINTVRRSVMQALTQDIGYTDSDMINGPVKNIRRILICRPNQRLGNLLLITPLLQEVTATYPRCKIDLFVKGNLAPKILRNYNNIDNIIQLPKKPFTQPFRYLKSWLLIRQKNYDLAINVDKKSSSGRLSWKKRSN
nr:hypothetical protein [uncultured Flavobacterium sp.]